MPNNHTQLLEIHCQTEVIAKKIAKSLIGEEGKFDFQTIIPRPKSQEDNWYDWNIEHWGTKWNAYNTEVSVVKHSCKDKAKHELERHSDITLQYRFWTAWAPPTPIYEELAKEFFRKYNVDVWFEVSAYDEFTMIPIDKKDEGKGFHIDPEQLGQWNSVDKVWCKHASPEREDFFFRRDEVLSEEQVNKLLSDNDVKVVRLNAKDLKEEEKK